MIYLYVLLYLTTVVWCTAAFLYSDGYLVHSKTAVVFAPILCVVALTLAGLRLGLRKSPGYMR